MQEKLTLNDGTVLENSRALLSNYLFLYVNGYDLKTVFDLLIDPGRAKMIIYTQNNGETVTYNGYKKLISVSDEGNNLVTAVLLKEVSQ